MSSRGMLRYDSITVSSARELTSVSMRHSQGEEVDTSLSRIMYCTHVVVFYCSRSFLVCLWVSFVARSCATKDSNNKDYVCKPTIPAEINRLPPSKIISPVTRVQDHLNTRHPIFLFSGAVPARLPPPPKNEFTILAGHLVDILLVQQGNSPR